MEKPAIAIACDFLRCERVGLRRYLIDRLRCELDLDDDEAEQVVHALVAAGWLRAIEITHYDPALEDMDTAAALAPGRRLDVSACGPR